MRFGAATFHLEPGATELLEGKVEYNVDGLEPEVEYSLKAGEAKVRVEPKGDIEIRGLPTEDIRNDWEVRLTEKLPLSLRIEAGAFQGGFDLSGLRLTALTMRTGAARATISFHESNPETMESLTLETGASEFNLEGLGNANMERMTFKSGLGRYTLDFSGALQHSAEVKVETGVSKVTITVPQATGARVILEEQVTDTDIYGFRQEGEKGYINDAYEGAEVSLTIRIKMGLGSLTLRSE